MFKVNDKVGVYYNGELQDSLVGQVMSVEDGTVLVKPISRDIPPELQELFTGGMRIPHNLDGIAQGEDNEGYSIKPWSTEAE